MPNVDLAELEQDEKLRKKRAKVTIVEHRHQFWSQAEIKKLTANLRPECCAHTDPEQPGLLMITGERSQACCAAVLGHNHFTLKVYQGLDNPGLPFAPPAYF